jgi:hypothetical protein
VYVAEIPLYEPAYRHKTYYQFERELLRRVDALSYVDAVSVGSVIPFRDGVAVPRVQTSAGQTIHANTRTVDGGYFNVMRIPLLSGRGFTDAYAFGSAPVALVSESLARALSPDANPLGKPLYATGVTLGTTIVGVVGDVHDRSLLERPMPAFYLPRTQVASSRVFLLIRVQSEGRQLAADLRQIVGEVYPEQPIQRIDTLEQIVGESVAGRRASAVIVGTFATVMLLLAGLGLCGHLWHVMQERARNFAIRSALGASSRHQLRLLIQDIVPALIGGVSVAMVAVYSCFPLVAPFLFEIRRLDPISYGAGALLVIDFTAAALLVPGRRLSRIDAATILRAS